jgi:hypothetical protein
VSQILLAGAQLGATTDVILPGQADPQGVQIRVVTHLRFPVARQVPDCDDYAELFDPYADTRGTSFRLSDDIAAVAADLIHGLKHYRADRKLEALWWWQYSYFNHWGTHAGAALRALHAVVAHARLDVAEEQTVL